MKLTKYFIILLIYLPFDSTGQENYINDVTLNSDYLGGSYLRLLSLSLQDLRETKIPICLGDIKTAKYYKYDSIPFSAYNSNYLHNKDFSQKYAIEIANAIEIDSNSINFYCKNHLVIDSGKIIYSVFLSDLKKLKKNSLFRKIFLDFFHNIYYKNFSLSYFSFTDFTYTKRMIDIAAREFLNNVNTKKVEVNQGLGLKKVNFIPKDSMYSNTALLEYTYTYNEKYNKTIFEIKSIGFSYRSKYETKQAFEYPRRFYYISPKKLKKVLGDEFSFFLLKGIIHCFYINVDIGNQ